MAPGTDRRALLSKKACSRCRNQKRRCDRAKPDCGLCTRLGQVCEYESALVPTLDLTPSPSPNPEILHCLAAFTPSHLQAAVIQKLGRLTPEDTLSAYKREVEPWFPVISISKLRSRLPETGTWDETPLDVALLCLSIIVLTTRPPSSLEDENDPSEFKSLYLYAKSSMALAEGLGINSFLLVQSRILVTLFEVAHGFYPAAYISIGTTIRAADTLEVMQPGAEVLPSHSLDNWTTREDTVAAWCGILILDRFIALESGPRPSLARSHSRLFHDTLRHTICATYQQNQDHLSPLYRFFRLFEASTLLDKVYTMLNSPTADHAFDTAEVISNVQTVVSLQTVLNGEIGEEARLYAAGLDLCNIALLIAFQNGSKIPVIPGVTDNCQSIATPSLTSILSIVTHAAETFTLGTQTIDLNRVPPFVTYLVYRAAAIVTERLLVDSNSDEELKRLRVLRTFLKMVGERWLGYERYLKVLDEDTTPRILKAIERGC